MVLFYLFSLSALLCAVGVVLFKNYVKAVLLLVLTFVFTSGIWIFLEAEFLAITLILVYVGAVMVLFLFVVMMLDIPSDKDIPYNLIVTSTMFLIPTTLLFVVSDLLQNFYFWLLPNVSVLVDKSSDYSNIKVLGELLYSCYIFAFEIVGLLLLVGLIVAVSLTYRGEQNRLSQNISFQVSASPKNRVTLVD